MPWWAWLVVGLWAAGLVLAVVLARAAAVGDRDLQQQTGTGDEWADDVYLEVLVADACAALHVELGVLLVLPGADADELTVAAEFGTGGALRGRRVSAGPGAGARLLPRARNDVQAVASAPVVVGGRAAGQLTVATVDAARRFDEVDLERLDALAERCAAVLADALPGAAPEPVAGMGGEAQAGVPARARRARMVATLAGKVAERLGMDAEGRREIQLAAALQGIGDLRFWRAEGSAGMPLIGSVAQFRDERWDGTGPHGVTGDRIPLGSRILAACDVWLTALDDAQPDAAQRAAIAAVRRESGRRLDPTVADALLAAVGAQPGRFRRAARDGAKRHQ